MPDATFLIRAHGRSRTLARRLISEILTRGHRLVLSNEMLAEVTKVLRSPHFQGLYRLPDAELLEYSLFLQSVSDIVILDPHHAAPYLQDPNDLHLLQTADRGEADILCTHDSDFYDNNVLSFCISRGILVCSEISLLRLLVES